MISYFTVEDLTGGGGLDDLVHEISLSGEDITPISLTEELVVIKYESDSWGDEKDICSLIAVTLLEMGINKFSIYYEGDNGE
jgi:hypothetical protein